MATKKLMLDYVFENEATHGDSVFLTQPIGGGQVTDYTWKQVVDQARRMAAHIKAQKFEPGARIALLVRPLEVKLTVDGQDFLLWAGEHRPDVAAAGFGDGYSGFVWEAPAHFRDGRPHRVEAVCKGQPLPGSPRLVTFARLEASQG